MRAIILAGGFGTRLKSVIPDIPKPMAPVNGRPFLEMLIRKLRCQDITDIILSVGYKKEVIHEHFGDGSSMGVSINYSSEDSPLGTGGAINAAMNRFPADRFLVMNGDSFFDNDLSELLTYHLCKQARITLALAQVSDISRYGTVETNLNGSISCFIEKSGSGPGIINGGVYIMEERVKVSFPGEVFSFENDMLRKSIGKGLFGLRQQGFFIDIGVPDDYEYCCKKYAGTAVL
jgi:NDP-sugar pyrophosphorylase family protein